MAPSIDVIQPQQQALPVHQPSTKGAGDYKEVAVSSMSDYDHDAETKAHDGLYVTIRPPSKSVQG